MTAHHWVCPYCGHACIIREGDTKTDYTNMTIPNATGNLRLEPMFIVCPNPKCHKFTLSLSLYKATQLPTGNYTRGELVQSWNLVPPSHSKAFPDYVPKQIIDDYNEACLICDLSPKASATLSRRCLQGIIRDFWRVKAGRLVDEIEQIKDRIDPLTWDAIESVRKVGNIGAHMEKDINLIVEVDPNEAGMLIGLIEILLKDWYVDREERRTQLIKIKSMADAKQPERKEESPNNEQ